MILLRYFSKEVLLNTTAVSLVLLLIMLSTRFVKYLASAAAGNLDTGVVFQLILYRIPDFLQLILPLGLFVALLLVYGRLYLDNEMRVLYAAGISRFRILMSMLPPVLLVTLLVAFISLWLSPLALEKVEIIYHQQDVRSELDSLKAGQFQPFRNNRGIIYTEEITEDVVAEKADSIALGGEAQVLPSMQAPQMHMKNVYIFQQEDFQVDGDTQRGDVVIVAKSGKQLIDERGRYLLLEQGYRLRDIKSEHRFEKVEFARYGQRIENHHATEAQLETDALPNDLLRQSSRRDYQVAWQWRLSVVLLVPVVALIAIALGKADPRQGRYFKILPAILLYLLYLILLNVARTQLIAGKLPLAWGMWWVHGLFFLTGYLLFNIENWMPAFLSRRADRQNKKAKSASSEVAS